ncbi:alkaline phosphatase family protein [Stenotrophobium rhamnosiphilum]|uniref:Phosphoesterase n=1 Tax=Stenotrophobium rhamnosiphilum TaxID=2029166 RepID=A0A2T5MGP0_9GAMM|nr:alkaline phosphatase family protein [Stenotrophobium rhamnosiphilum]PTU31727.1 phosphoesterase [Stenotrophobium rhamnosiphilum]
MRLFPALFAFAVSLALAACGTSSPTSSTGGSSKVGHVFIIVLENKSYAKTFPATGTPPAPYLAKNLPAMGAMLTQYHGTGHLSLDNYITMVGGQAPNLQTSTDCIIYTDWVGTTTPDGNGQVTGTGCVYPFAVKTIANQLQDKGLSWKGYMEDMGNDLARDGRATCAHPDLNTQDKTQSASATDLYAARHNPFMYYHSIIDDQANCDAHVVPLTALSADLASIATTPNYVFITPNLCNDGHDTDCVNGKPGGYESINDFLKEWVPKITKSAAFKKDGLLIVTFDESEFPGEGSEDSAACCNEPAGPNFIGGIGQTVGNLLLQIPVVGGPLATLVNTLGLGTLSNVPLAGPGLVGPGGGRIGAVLVSPFIKPGTVSDVPYNHYSMLRSIEDIFEVAHLGYAAQPGLVPFGDDIFNQ